MMATDIDLEKAISPDSLSKLKKTFPKLQSYHADMGEVEEIRLSIPNINRLLAMGDVIELVEEYFKSRRHPEACAYTLNYQKVACDCPIGVILDAIAKLELTNE